MVEWTRTLVVLLVLAGCTGTRVQGPQPDAASKQPRAAAPRKESPPATGRDAVPACDPRARDPDRGRVALGVMAADCADDRGRNRAYVTRLVPIQGSPSPAQRGGVRVGDRLVRLDACEIPSTHELAVRLRSAPPGWVPRLVIEREGREVEIFVATIKLPDKAEPPAAPQLSTAGCKAIGRQAAK